MDVPMVTVTCCNCGMSFAITDAWERVLRRSHNTFYCPQGHSQYFPGKSDLELAREERDAARRARDEAQHIASMRTHELAELQKKHKPRKRKAKAKK